MPAIVSTVDITCPPDVVFAYATDPSRFAEWQRDVVAVRLEGGQPAQVGARFTTTRRVGGVNRTMTQEVVASDPPRRWAVRGVDGPIRPSAALTVEPVDDAARSRVTFELDFEGHGIGRALLPAVRRQAARGAPASYRALKQRLERGAA